MTRPSRRGWRELPWIAAGLGAFAARDARGQSSSVDVQFLFYKESGGRTQVLNPVVLWNQDLGSGGQLGLSLGYDSISGASPTGAYPTADVTTSASGNVTASGNIPQASYTDTRKSAGLSWGRRFGANLPTVNLTYAKENDYMARGLEVSDAWTLLGGRATLHFGFALARDIVSPVKNPETNPDGADLNYPKNTNGFSLGWTWVFGSRDVADLSLSLMNLSGYLTDPYKVVPIGPPDSTQTLAENRPTTRSRRAAVIRYSHYFLWDASVNVLYRYYNDDWSISAHTLDLTYNHRLSPDWIVSPEIRFYTQTGASFFANRFAAPQTYMSADYRLSPFTSFLGGLTLSHRLNEAFSANVGATFQTQHSNDPIHLVTTTPDERGTTSVSAADMNVLTFVLGADVPLLKNATGRVLYRRCFPLMGGEARRRIRGRPRAREGTGDRERRRDGGVSHRAQVLALSRDERRVRDQSLCGADARRGGRGDRDARQGGARPRADDGGALRPDGGSPAPGLGLQACTGSLGRGDRGAASARAGRCRLGPRPHRVPPPGRDGDRPRRRRQGVCRRPRGEDPARRRDPFGDRQLRRRRPHGRESGRRAPVGGRRGRSAPSRDAADSPSAP